MRQKKKLCIKRNLDLILNSKFMHLVCAILLGLIGIQLPENFGSQITEEVNKWNSINPFKISLFLSTRIHSINIHILMTDFLGHDLPPDELNRAPKKGIDFGFPACFGKNIQDPEVGVGVDCTKRASSTVDLAPQ